MIINKMKSGPYSKLITMLIICIATLAIFSSCSKEEGAPVIADSNSDFGESEIADISHNDTINIDLTEPDFESTEAETEPMTEPPTQPPKLSDECDKIIACGYDADNNYYELVANESEDYTGTTIEMGVIKNNAWSIPMTTDCPFIDEISSIYDVGEYDVISYIGAGCFALHYYKHFYATTIWNGNNGKYYSSLEDREHCEAIITCNTNYVVECNEGYVLLHGKHFYAIMNTNTMEIKDSDIYHNYSYEYPYSEGLFAVANDGFYNLDFEKVIDLTQFNISYSSSISDSFEFCDPNLVFKNGTCSFKVTNDQGSEYMLTIDKNGNVINSVKIEE